MTDREIMRQALDALEVAYGVSLIEDIIPKDAPIKQAITALRTAIEQAEKQEPRCAVIVEVFGKDWRLDYMSLPVGKHKLYTQEYVYTAPPQQEKQDDLAYREAVSLAKAIFKKHFAHEEHYASGRIVWQPLDTTAGVISQIDNMTCRLVAPAAERERLLSTDIHSCHADCQRFACVQTRAAVAAEREACAKVCEEDFGNGALNLAAAIRARGQA